MLSSIGVDAYIVIVLGVTELKQKKDQLRIRMHGIVTVSYISNNEHSINGSRGKILKL